MNKFIKLAGVAALASAALAGSANAEDRAFEWSITVGGTTTAGGSFGFRVRVTDDAGASATRTFVWNVSTPGGEAPPVGAGRAAAGCTATGHSAGLWALLVLIVALGVLRRSRYA